MGRAFRVASQRPYSPPEWRAFGSTVGVASTDAITTTLTAHATLRTYSIWAMKRGNGGGALGRLWEKRTAGGQVEQLYWAPGGNDFKYNRASSGNPSSQWGIYYTYADHRQPELLHLVVSMDAGSIANTPAMYMNGLQRDLYSSSAGSGSWSTNADAYVIGNRTNDSARNWDGWLADFAVWDAILTAGEVAALWEGAHPKTIRGGSLVEHVPLGSNRGSTVRAGSLTITGTRLHRQPGRNQLRAVTPRSGGPLIGKLGYPLRGRL